MVAREMFASVTASGVSGVAKGTSDIAAAAAARAAQSLLCRYHVPIDGLCRRRQGRFPAEATRILASSMQDGWVVLSPVDKAYVAQMVAMRTGLSQPEAQQRVDTVVDQLNDAEQKMRQAADAARKRAARLSIATALSMLIGAFIASVAAAHGGRIRDEY